MRYLLSLLILINITSLSVAQKRECGSDEIRRELLTKNPELKASFDRINREAFEYRQTHRTLNDAAPDTVAVVFHIVYRNLYDSIPESVIKMQLAILNMDFNGQNSDQYKVPTAFKPRIGNMNIIFKLAKTDPNGNPTNGINYRKTSRQQVFNNDDFFKRDYSEGLSIWDRNRYLNIWVVELMEYNGYAFLPGTGGADDDGVAINPRAFGIREQNMPETNYGRTLVHEVGHFFGLYHVFGDTNDDTPFLCESDGVDDTPPQAAANYGFHTPTYIHTSCSNGPNGDMWMNYMDYCAHLNRYMFTIKQVERAKSFLQSAPRKTLLLQGLYLNPVHQKANNPELPNGPITQVAVGKDEAIWAGTNQNGLYKLTTGKWAKSGLIDNRNINQITTDKHGGIWIAQSGHDGPDATAGGISYFGDSTFASHKTYTKSTGFPSRNVQGIYIDTVSTKPLTQVWVSSYPHLQTVSADIPKLLQEGGLYYCQANPSSALPIVSTNVSGTLNYYAQIAGNGNEVWVVDNDVQSDNYLCEIRRFDAVTSGPITPSFNFDNTGGVIPQLNDIKALYIDRGNNKWVGLLNDGLAYADTINNWQSIFFPEIFPDGSSVNSNAIIQDEIGDVFIGTTQGLVMYNGGDVNDVNSYKLFTMADGLPSKNILSLAILKKLDKLVIGTDNGITYRDLACLWNNCPDPKPPVIATTIKAGNWNDPTIWNTGKVPDCNTITVINNKNVFISGTAAVCGALFMHDATEIRCSTHLTLSPPGCQ